MWECTQCSVENDLDPDAEEGQIVICIECNAEFEVQTLEPLELERLETVDVDDDSTDEDDDEDDDWGNG
jgi:hypothetical protein